MKTDFTISTYKNLLESLSDTNYSFHTVVEYLQIKEGRVVILRHDVDALPENALRLAEIEHNFNIKGTYYFRAIPKVFQPVLMKQIADLGHEIGYHYEEVDLCNGDKRLAIELFKKNLERFRTISPIQTICMHGSPRSAFDNKSLWTDYDYRNYGISGEPYLDIDFERIQYLTDTGRRWDGDRFNIRDKVRREGSKLRNEKIRTTMDIIRAVGDNKLAEQIMINIHPQRWHDQVLPWMHELVWQNVKNVVKLGITTIGVKREDTRK